MYIRGFDGLRAVAMFLVFLTHKTLWGEKAQIGFAGVWVFFLLSGFLITGQLAAAQTRMGLRQTTLRQEVVTFWIKRAARIFPAYYFLLLLVVPFYLLTKRDVPGLPYYSTYLSNFFFQAEPSQFLTTFAHFWTLAVEEQFYILFAPLLLLVPARFGACACCAVILASLFRRFWLAHLDVAAYVIYIDSLVNFGLLALGGLLYLCRDAVARMFQTLRLERAWVGWIALPIVIGCPWYAALLAGDSLVRLQTVYVSGALFAALLLMNVFVNQKSALTNVLEWRAIAYFGRISYGLYLYNDYVKVDLPQRAAHFLSSRTVSAAGGPLRVDRLLEHMPLELILEGLGLVTCLIVTIVLAKLSFEFVEKPALRLRNLLLQQRGRVENGIARTGPIELVPERQRLA